MINTGDKLLIELPQIYISIDSSDIEAITDSKKSSAIPTHDSFIEGVISHRGETFALISLVKLLNIEAPQNLQNKIVIVKNDNKQIALSVPDYPMTFITIDALEEIEKSQDEEKLLISISRVNNKVVKELDWVSAYNQSILLLAPKKQTFRVLLVDDEQFFKDTIKDILKDSRFTVIAEATNGEEGVKLSAELKPDIIIMDIMMPIKNGIVATAEITALELPAQVVMCSSTTEGDSIERALNAGAKGFIKKPIVKQEFLDTLNKVTSLQQN